MLISNCICLDISIFFVTVLVFGYFYVKYKYGYWNRRGIPQLKPTFPFGNFYKTLPKGISIGYVTKKFYDEFKKMGVKYGGVYFGVEPYIVVMDPLDAKNILTKDFQYFTDRGIFYSKKDPLSKSILTEDGAEWRHIRGKVTNLFTSAKIKYFFHTMLDCTKDYSERLEEYARKNEPLEIQETLACYFTDIIASVVYGMEARSFKSPDADFRTMGRIVFHNKSIIFRMIMFLAVLYPKILRMINIKLFPNTVNNFFTEIVKETVEYRRKNNVTRADFIQLMIDLQNTDDRLTLPEITSQATVFFLGGFETSSTSATMTLFELGRHPEIQNQVREEINQVLKKYNGQITYEAIGELKVLNQVFNETTRKYPPLATIPRVCVKDYKFENSDVTIKKGVGVLIPVLGFHRDENIFHDPEEWDPERFEDKNVKYDGYYPFGDGPRNCIGARFGLLQVKLGLITLIKDFKFSISSKTKLPVFFDPLTFVMSPSDIFLDLEKIN